MATLLKPGRIKLAFLLPWLMYLGFELILGENILLPVSGLTLLFLYILGGLAELAEQQYGQLGSRFSLLAGAGALAALDHLAKLVVLAFLPIGKRVALIPGSIDLQQTLNMEAAWLPNRFGFVIPIPLLSILAIAIMLISVAVYNYYTGTHRRTTYSDLALVLLFAGALSAFGDQIFRGYTVDFLAFKGFFVADLKDIYLSLGLAGVLAEVMTSPAKDPALRELPALLVRIIRYNLKFK